MSDIQEQLEKSLPFDQYSRQKIVAYLIENGVKKATNRKHLKLIDLGGHKGQTTHFQSEDHVIILDVFDETYNNYVKGDATKTDFQDGAFDVACSFDVFEHIPRQKRQAFISEALRISKYGLFVAMPVDTKRKVSAAEKLLNEFHRTLFSSDHPWLKEHIDYMIPTGTEITELIGKVGAHSASVYSNQIGDWQLMQMMIFAAAKNREVTQFVDDINYWYNKHTLELDGSADIGYRGVFFISKDDKMVNAVESAIASMKPLDKKINKYTTVNQATFRQFSATFAKVSKQYTMLIEKYDRINRTRGDLLEETNNLKKALIDSQTYNSQLHEQLNNVYNSMSWKLTRPVRLARKLMSKGKKL